MSAASTRPLGRALRLRVAPPVVAVLSLVATAAMWSGYPVIPALAWIVLLLGVAVGCAASARRTPADRRAPADRRRDGSHLAVEPFTMALMVVLGLFHTHGRVVAGDPVTTGHAGHGGWLLGVLAVAVAVLTVVCLVLAARHVRAVGLARGALPIVAAAAMAVMGAGMLLPA